MDYSSLLDEYSPAENKLLAYGFSKKAEDFILKKDMAEKDFFLQISFAYPNKLKAMMFDKTTGEEYLPFSLITMQGDFVSKAREEAESYLKDVIASCFVRNSCQEKLVAYIKQKYDADLSNPWSEYPDFITLKEKGNPHWFGLLMPVAYKRLGIDREGEGKFINLKLNPEEIASLADNKYFFPAYHMNKKYWITVLLSSDAPFDKITGLVDESYNNVRIKAKKKGR
jgi:predicted DNA-binding protein (MmcQ/YjbR family)